jgi:PadR family transcriptional regulator, regulatory protein AphA
MSKAVRSSKPCYSPSRNGLREAILGLLAIKPMTGYDLSRSYKRALQQIWYAPLGQIYPSLRQMQRAGLLRVAVKVQQHRPNRKIYSLTPEGRRLLIEWLGEPAELPRMHHEFIHKLFLLRNVAVAERATLVDSYAERSTEWAADLRRAERALETSLQGPNAESARFQLLSLRHLCRLVECEASSARSVAADIRSGRFRARFKRTADGFTSEGGPFGELPLSPARRLSR